MYAMAVRTVVAAKADPSLLDLLRNDPRFDVELRPETAGLAGAEIAITRTTNRVDRRAIESAPGLRAIAQATSGIDNIDVDAAREHGVDILHLPGINANAVAELVIGFILSLTRTIPFYTREVVAGRWSRDDCSSRHELAHYRLGIVGLGHAGGRVATLAAAFGMRVTAFDPYVTDAAFRARGASRASSLAELAGGSDIVTLHVPLTNETRGMFDAGTIGAMPRGSILINTARGEVLDADAALAALKRNHLGGLALDVHDPEPPLRRFPDDPRLIVTPHIAGCTSECRRASGERLYQKLVEWIESRTT